MSTDTWFVTGGTPGGFGMAYAEAVLARGGRVALTVRRPEELDAWAEEHGGDALVLPLDVTEPDGVRAAVAAAEEHFGGIDVLVNNAGRGWYGSVEGMDEAAVRHTFEVNFFSVLHVTRAVLPGMRSRGGGWVVNMSSVAGLVGTPGFGFYTAAKFALEGMTEVLRHETEPFGIRVMAVEPGAFRTRAYAGFTNEPVREPLTAHLPMLEEVRAAMVSRDGVQPGDPARGVRAVLAAMERNEPPHRLVLGAAGYEAVAARWEESLAALRADEALSRGADFPPGG
ncbi:SDR family NAD(P)-dependent oxidoreductase [Nocardiopsis sp. M1B1]|uniref:SDR family NAD(P)-dependent oxidoreductase n=1 Tax=Nocardiopsis sp. M1B1 TaxID=3450454 RepID=UPI00403A3922